MAQAKMCCRQRGVSVGEAADCVIGNLSKSLTYFAEALYSTVTCFFFHLLNVVYFYCAVLCCGQCVSNGLLLERLKIVLLQLMTQSSRSEECCY